jgi:hypothetical protein
MVTRSSRARPWRVTAVGILFVFAGIAGFVYHALRLRQPGPVDRDLYLILSIRVIALVIGVLLLLRVSWARWMAMAWMAYHIGLSAVESSVQGVAVHFALLVIIGYLLLRSDSAAYFRGPSESGLVRPS